MSNSDQLDSQLPNSWKAENARTAWDEFFAHKTSHLVGTAFERQSLIGIPLGPLPEGYRVAARGLDTSGRFGSPTSWERNEPLASTIEIGGKMILAGRSLEDVIAYAANTMGAGVTPAGRRMTSRWWRSTLTNPKYAGYHVPSFYQGYRPGPPSRPRRTVDSHVVPCLLPAIFSLDDWHRLCHALARGYRRPKVRHCAPAGTV